MKIRIDSTLIAILNDSNHTFWRRIMNDAHARSSRSCENWRSFLALTFSTHFWRYSSAKSINFICWKAFLTKNLFILFKYKAVPCLNSFKRNKPNFYIKIGILQKLALFILKKLLYYIKYETIFTYTSRSALALGTKRWTSLGIIKRGFQGVKLIGFDGQFSINFEEQK